jgi:3-keto-disaccharide hydrolase
VALVYNYLMKSAALILLVAFGCFTSGFAADNTLTTVERQEGYELLFDGKTLDGWQGDPRLWSVQEGAIVGSTFNQPLKDNSFLISRQVFSDFVLQADIRLDNHNSGIQFRSEALPDFVVRGYQADAAQGNWWGSLYGEKTGRGVIANGWAGKGETVVRPGWNHYEIFCQGSLIRLTLNGLVTVEIEDTMAAEGILALQLHAGPPMKVAFRNIKIKRLPAKPIAASMPREGVVR